MSRKKIIAWIFGVLGLLIVITGVGGYFLIQSKGFHRYVIAKIEQKAYESTGGRVEIRGFDVHLSTLSVDVYGLVVHGKEPASARPLFALDHIYVDLKLGSLIHHKIDLKEIVANHPVVNLIAYKNGETNIPRPSTPKKDDGSSVNVFDLGIQHVLLDRGEVYYNQQKSPLQAELHNLRTEVTYQLLTSKYVGSISYDDGRLQLADTPPLPHNLNVNFEATPTQLTVTSAALNLASSQVNLQGSVSNFSQPKASGKYQILIRPQDFQALIGKTASVKGDIRLSGDLGYQNAPGQPLLETVYVHGRIDSPQLDVVTPQVQLPVRALRGNYSLDSGNLRATSLAADLLGGHLDAELNIANMTGTPTGRFHAGLAGISLGTIRTSARLADVKTTPLTGRIDGSVNGGWAGSLSRLEAIASVNLKGAISPAVAAPLPLDGSIHVNYNGAQSTIAFNNTYFRTPETTIQIAGTMSEHSNVQVSARTNNVQELSTLATALQTPKPGQPSRPAPLQISGTAALNAALRGTMNNPQINGNASAQNLAFRGGHWPNASFSFQASPGGASITQGSITAAPKGQASFSMSVGLQKWKYSPSSPLTANISVQQLPLAQLRQVANLDYPVTGNLDVKIAFKGSQLNPLGDGKIQISQAEAYNQKIQTLTLNFHAAGDTVNSTLSVKTPAGPLNAEVVLRPKTKAYDLKMSTSGIDIAKIDLVQERNAPVAGTLKIFATGQGTFDNPQLAATVQIPELQMRQASVKQVKAQLNLANHRGNLTLDSDVVGASIQARADVDLIGNYDATASFDTKGISLAPLIALYKPVPDQFQGLLEIHATAKGPLKQASAMEAHITIPTLRASYQQLQIANAGPIRVDYVNSVIRIPQAQISGTDTSLRIEGEIPMKGSAPPRLNAKGSVNLELVKVFSPDVQSSGQLLLDVHATRTALTGLGVQGQVRLQQVAFSTLTAPVGVENLNGTLDIQNNQVQIRDFTAQVGGGQITAGGNVIYKPTPKFNLALQAKNIRLRYPEGVRAVLDSQLTFTGTPQDSSLGGRVLIDNVSFTPDFDMANFIGQFGGGSAPPSGQGFTQHMHLAITLQTASNLNLASSTISLQGQANLRVIGTADNPVIVGRANFTGGELFFMNKRYQIMRGIINFANPSRTEPVVNMLITTTVQQYNLSLSFIGPIDKLRTSYTSDPPLPPVDVINLLARGQTTEEAAPAAFNANSALAEGLASQVGSRVGGSIQKLAGLSSLQIDPTLGGNGTDPTARVAIQQRVTKNFLFTFSTDVSDPESQVVQGEYQVDRHWSVSAARDQYGGYAFDAKYHKTF